MDANAVILYSFAEKLKLAMDQAQGPTPQIAAICNITEAFYINKIYYQLKGTSYKENSDDINNIREVIFFNKENNKIITKMLFEET
jgi:hypothetical protein